MLVQRDKGDLLLAGQKSGEVFALDPDKGGAVVWRRRVGSGSSNGGVHHGMATDGERVYVPVADPERKIAGLRAEARRLRAVGRRRRSALVAAGAARLHFRPEGRTAGRPRRDGEGQVRPLAVAGLQLLLRPVGGSGLRERSWSTPARSTASCACSTPRPASRCGSSRPTRRSRQRTASKDTAARSTSAARSWTATSCSSLSGYGMFGQMPGNMLLVYGLKRKIARQHKRVTAAERGSAWIGHPRRASPGSARSPYRRRRRDRTRRRA